MLGVYLIDVQYRTPKQSFICLDELDSDDRLWGTQTFTNQIWGTLNFEEKSYLFTIPKVLLQEMINNGSAIKLL